MPPKVADGARAASKAASEGSVPPPTCASAATTANTGSSVTTEPTKKGKTGTKGKATSRERTRMNMSDFAQRTPGNMTAISVEKSQRVGIFLVHIWLDPSSWGNGGHSCGLALLFVLVQPG